MNLPTNDEIDDKIARLERQVRFLTLKLERETLLITLAKVELANTSLTFAFIQWIWSKIKGIKC